MKQKRTEKSIEGNIWVKKQSLIDVGNVAELLSDLSLIYKSVGGDKLVLGDIEDLPPLFKKLRKVG